MIRYCDLNLIIHMCSMSTLSSQLFVLVSNYFTSTFCRLRCGGIFTDSQTCVFVPYSFSTHKISHNIKISIKGRGNQSLDEVCFLLYLTQILSNIPWKKMPGNPSVRQKKTPKSESTKAIKVNVVGKGELLGNCPVMAFVSFYLLRSRQINECSVLFLFLLLLLLSAVSRQIKARQVLFFFLFAVGRGALLDFQVQFFRGVFKSCQIFSSPLSPTTSRNVCKTCQIFLIPTQVTYPEVFSERCVERPSGNVTQEGSQHTSLLIATLGQIFELIKPFLTANQSYLRSTAVDH